MSTAPDPPGPPSGARPADPARVALVAELDALRAHLRGDARTAADAAPPGVAGPLDALAAGFGLTAFERGVLLLAAGPELVAAMAEDLAAAGAPHGLTFGLALAVLPGADWSATTPAGPLRRWELLHLDDPGSPTRSPLRVDERVLHHLAGAGHLDPEVAAVAREAAPVGLPAPLRDAARAVADAWAGEHIVVLDGPVPADLPAVAATAAGLTGARRLLRVAAADLPGDPRDRARLLRLMEREAVLSGCCWAVEIDDPAAHGGLRRALEGFAVPLVVMGADVEGAVAVTVPRLDPGGRTAVLAAELRSRGVPAGDAARAAAAFDLPVTGLVAAAADAAAGRPVWDACRARARRPLCGSARVVTPRAGWADLVLPAGQLGQLRALVEGVRHRTRVLHEWGFAQRSGRGTGTAALFTGPSGTGKTLAAEVVAGELDRDLVVVDLSQVVSKYVGETEKNLARVFEAAEDSGAVLLFDEADTLFGRRTEVRDSHDRYANLEVGYLLQRVESFCGLAVLTTNSRSGVDQAFLRRLGLVVTFPYPDAAAREALWRRAFPAGVPTAGLDPARLATVDLPGGGIAAAALTAAYLGAGRGEVRPEDVAAATRWELAKHGRSAGRT